MYALVVYTSSLLFYSISGSFLCLQGSWRSVAILRILIDSDVQDPCQMVLFVLDDVLISPVFSRSFRFCISL